MGAAASAATASSGAPSASAVNALPPVRRDAAGGAVLVPVLPLERELAARVKGGHALLEVSADGFRVLRDGGDALAHFMFPQVHSWAHVPSRFTFRFYEEKTKKLRTHGFATRWVQEILAAVHEAVDTILAARKSKSLPEHEFEALVDELETTPEADRRACIEASCATSFFSASQAARLVALVVDTFDQIECVCVLHPKLIDQCSFALLLNAMHDREARDNVWHRLAVEKAKGSRSNSTKGARLPKG